MRQDDLKTKNGASIEFNYSENKEVEDDNSALFSLVYEPKTELQERYCPEYSLILFLLNGNIQITDPNLLTTTVKSGQCVFMPKNESVNILTMEDSSAVLMRFSYRTFMPHEREVWDDCFGGIEPCVHPVLDISPFLSMILANIMETQKLLVSPNYQRIKAEEIHEIARQCYSTHQRAWFCQSIIRPKDDFRAFIEANFDKAKTCLEMAEMTGMSGAPFRRLFRKTFGESVHDWLMKQKAIKMNRLIIEGEQDYKRLMTELNFTDKTSYIRFCRRWMGGNPSEIIQHIIKNKLSES